MRAFGDVFENHNRSRFGPGTNDGLKRHHRDVDEYVGRRPLASCVQRYAIQRCALRRVAPRRAKALEERAIEQPIDRLAKRIDAWNAIETLERLIPANHAI